MRLNGSLPPLYDPLPLVVAVADLMCAGQFPPSCGKSRINPPHSLLHSPSIHPLNSTQIPHEESLVKRRQTHHATRREAGDFGDVGVAQGRGVAGAENQGVAILEDILIIVNDGAEAQGNKGNCGGAGAYEFRSHCSCARAEWSKWIWPRYSSFSLLH